MDARQSYLGDTRRNPSNPSSNPSLNPPQRGFELPKSTTDCVNLQIGRVDTVNTYYNNNNTTNNNNAGKLPLMKRMATFCDTATVDYQTDGGDYRHTTGDYHTDGDSDSGDSGGSFIDTQQNDKDKAYDDNDGAMGRLTINGVAL